MPQTLVYVRCSFVQSCNLPRQSPQPHTCLAMRPIVVWRTSSGPGLCWRWMVGPVVASELEDTQDSQSRLTARRFAVANAGNMQKLSLIHI
eukprot:3906769-Amphidinium_carterae.1